MSKKESPYTPGIYYMAIGCVVLFVMAMLPNAEAVYLRYTAYTEAKQPLVLTDKVALAPTLSENLRAHGVRELKAVPASSGAKGVYYLHVNGRTQTLSEFSEADVGPQMYAVTLTPTGAKVYIREDSKSDFSPRELQKLIEEDATQYLAKKQRVEARAAYLEKSWQ